jgi:hypothetical protein
MRAISEAAAYEMLYQAAGAQAERMGVLLSRAGFLDLPLQLWMTPESVVMAQLAGAAAIEPRTAMAQAQRVLQTSITLAHSRN